MFRDEAVFKSSVRSFQSDGRAWEKALSPYAFSLLCSSYYAWMWDVVTRRKCVRKVCKLSPRTRSVYLPLLLYHVYTVGTHYIGQQLCLRLCNFLVKGLKRQVHIVTLVSKLCMSSKSLVAANVRLYMSSVNSNSADMFMEAYSMADFRSVLSLCVSEHVSVGVDKMAHTHA